MDVVRIDKWLWAARFYKTRALATDAVLGGHVHLNGARVKPAKDVRLGDTVEIRIGTTTWTVVVAGLADKRGPAKVAQGLYTETGESRTARERQALERRVAPPPLGADLGARPTKQDRRRLDALRRAQRGRCVRAVRKVLPSMVDLRLVDALARLRLEAARSGYRVTLAQAPPELAELVELAGLSGTLGLELQRQPEEREEPLGVEEERHLPDPAS